MLFRISMLLCAGQMNIVVLCGLRLLVEYIIFNSDFSSVVNSLRINSSPEQANLVLWVLMISTTP